MSTLNDDQEVVNEGRRAPLKDVAAPLRDQIVDKLFKQLDDEAIGTEVVDMWNTAQADRASELARQRAYLEAWDKHNVPGTDGNFDGSSQIHVPLPLTICKTLHARFYQALMGIDPAFSIKARNEASMERVACVSDTMRYTLNDYYNWNKGIEEVVDKWLWDWVSSGKGIMKQRWDVKYTRFRDVTLVPKPQAPRSVIGEDGREVFVPQPPRMVEKEVDRTKKIFDGPVAELRNREDVVAIGSSDCDLADAVIESDKLTASDLWTLADRKVFHMAAVKDVIEGGQDLESGSDISGIKDDRAQNAGKSGVDTEADNDRYNILEAYLKRDVDGSGITSDIVVWVHKNSKRLLRATYLHRINKSGERPYSTIEFQPRKGQEPAGIIELIYPLAKELDAMHNMRIDMGLISVMPFGFYRASSGLDPKVIQYEPGALIPVDDPHKDVYFPNLGNRTVFGFQEEQALDQMIQRLTGVNEMSMGMMTSQGPMRTASGARALVGEMSSNLDIYLKRLNRGWRKFLRYTHHMLQQRIPDGLSFRVTGDDGKDYWRQIRTADDIAGDFDMDLAPNTASSNQGVQQENADQVLGIVLNPLLIQTGVVGVGNIFEAVKNKLQSQGIRDWARFISKPQGYERTLTPEEESNRILRGIEVPIQPGQDHEGFISYWEYMKSSDELLGHYDEQQTMLMEQQARKHGEMAKALEAMAAQQANSQQMRMNAAQSQQQAPAGMSAMNTGAAPVAAQA